MEVSYENTSNNEREREREKRARDSETEIQMQLTMALTSSRNEAFSSGRLIMPFCSVTMHAGPNGTPVVPVAVVEDEEDAAVVVSAVEDEAGVVGRRSSARGTVAPTSAVLPLRRTSIKP